MFCCEDFFYNFNKLLIELKIIIIDKETNENNLK